MAVLNVDWPGQWNPPKTAETTGGDAVASERKKADKPMMVWIVDPIEEDENAKTAQIAFDPDEFRIGSQFFLRIKLDAEKAEADPILSETGKKYPRMVFLTPDFEVVDSVEGKLSKSKLCKAMEKTAKKSYDGSLSKAVKAMRSLLTDLDKVANERKVLAEKDAKDLNRVEKQRIEKEIAEVEKLEKELIEKRDDLLKMKLKGTEA